MLKLYTWTTPNGYKVPIMLEELGLPYEIVPINIMAGEQKTSEYLALNPNGKIPTLVDTDGPGGTPITIFESGAIMWYLAKKTGTLIPHDAAGEYAALEWLMFQMASVGPMLGQAGHFRRFAPEKIEYGIKRYTDEAKRLYGVLELRLAQTEYLAGEYSVADIATWPWVRNAENFGIDITEFPHVKKWIELIAARPAVKQALEKTDTAAASKK